MKEIVHNQDEEIETLKSTLQTEKTVKMVGTALVIPIMSFFMYSYFKRK